MRLPCLTKGTSLSIAGGGRRISVEFLAGYRYAQVFAPKGKDFVALEPMTAPTNALVSGPRDAARRAGGPVPRCISDSHRCVAVTRCTPGASGTRPTRRVDPTPAEG